MCRGGTSRIGNVGRVLVEKPIFRSLAVKIERKCRSETANLWKSRQRWNAERNFTSLEVLAEQVRKAELQIFASQGRAEVRKQNITYLAVKAERKCGSGTSHIWQSMQNESADVELQIFGSKDRAEAELQFCGSQGRAEVQKRNIRSLAIKAEQKCGLGISDRYPSRQSRSAEAALQLFDGPVKLDVRKQILTSLTGPYPTDCHCQCWRITLLTAILKDNVKTMCGLNTWLSQCAWQGQYAPARALGNTGLNPFLGPSCRVKKSPSSRRTGPLRSLVPAVFGRDVCLLSGSLSHVSWFDHAW